MTNFRATNANISFKGRAPGQVFSDGDETIRDPPQEHSQLAVLRPMVFPVCHGRYYCDG